MLQKKSKSGQIAVRAVAVIAVFGILMSLAILRNGSIFGHEASGLFSSAKADAWAGQDTVATVSHAGRQMIINTTEIGKEISGYGGPVPLKIYVSKGRIDSVVALQNSESPKFFGRLESEGLTHAWDGRTIQEAATMDVDGVTGATYSSNAYIANVRAGVSYVQDSKPAASVPVSAAAIAALVVIAAGAIFSLFFKNPVYRIVQQLFNVAVLGFWAGTFIDYAMMLNFFSESPRLTLSFIITLALVIVGIIYPLFNKPNYYCTWICPFGSLQELAGKVSKKKWKMPARLVKILDNFRQILWVVLLSLLYIGWGTSWIDYEIFSAFIVESASWIVIVTGCVFVVLSIFVTRPFCRFVCPTGSLLKQA